MKKLIMLTAVAAMGLGVAACDSATENAAESQAQDVRESSEAAADKIESTPGGGDVADDKADAVREAGDATADAMEDKADKMDKGAPE
jgi:hypothetical protein